MALSSNVLNRAGPTNILSVTGQSSAAAGSSATVGGWYAIPAGSGRLAIQAILQTASVGATAGTTVTIEFTNSTSYPALGTKGLTIAITATTDLLSSGGGIDSTMDRAWGFIRANMNSLTTSTAGSAGAPTVNVIVGVGDFGGR